MTREEAEQLIEGLNDKLGINAHLMTYYPEQVESHDEDGSQVYYSDEGFDIGISDGEDGMNIPWNVELYYPVHDWLIENGATSVRRSSDSSYSLNVDWSEHYLDQEEIPKNPWGKHIKSLRMKYHKKVSK
mgnify:CR=1 FL=1